MKCRQLFANLKIKKLLEVMTNIHFLKAGNTCIILAPYLSTLCNHCLMKGVYSDGLKVAEVVPFFKKGDPNDVTNYRTISLLSNFNKIFEKLVYHR